MYQYSNITPRKILNITHFNALKASPFDLGIKWVNQNVRP